MPTLPVPFISQTTPRFCGPAVAAMILDFLGSGPLHGPGWQAAFQQALWTTIQAGTRGPGPPSSACTGRDPAFPNQQAGACISGHCVFWDTTPQALTAALSYHLPSANYQIVRQRDVAFDDVVLSILNSIDNGTPAAALGNGGQHWVVVRGYRQGKQTPKPIDIGGRKINGLYIRDSQRQYRNLMSIGWWQTWFDEVDCGVVDSIAGYSDHRMLIALVRQRIGVHPMPPGPPPPPPPTPPTPPQPPPPLPVARALTIGTQIAVDLLDEDPDEGLAVALKDAKPVSAFLVTNLDKPHITYWVLRFERNGKETARMAIDGPSGDLLEVESIGVGEDAIEPWVTPPLDPAGKPPRLIWKASSESPTPLLPFYEVVGPDGKTTYLRADGAKFDELTTGRGR